MLHHGFVDKMWWDWQMKDPKKRLTEIGGRNAQDPAVGFSEFTGGIEVESRMWGKPTPEMLAVTPDPQSGDGGPTLTLNHILTSVGIIPNATVKDIMDVRGDYLCWEYH
jgi:tyrosinase